MSTSCTHTFESGVTCKSPAVHDTNLCFHHTPHETIRRRQHHEYEPFELPPLRNKNAVLVAISEVLYRLSMRRIKRSEADTLIHGLNLVGRLMTEIDQTADSDPAGFDEMQSVAPPESEASSASIQKTLDKIAEDLGVEMPSFEELLQLQASRTPKQALDHLLSTGRIRPRQQAGGVTPAMRAHLSGHKCPRATAAESRPQTIGA